jgi:hypothetical protein
MTEERDTTASRSEPTEPPEPERYYAELVSSSEGGDLSVVELQEAMNEGARKSQRLVGVMNEPAGRGVILVWDQEGFISG